MKSRRSRLPANLLTASCLVFLVTSVLAESHDAVSAGAALFSDKGCTHCHGTNLQGTHKGPSLADVRKKLKASQMSDQIENGGRSMPSFEDLSKDEVAQLVAFLRAKHKPALKPNPEQATPSEQPPQPQTAPLTNPGQ